MGVAVAVDGVGNAGVLGELGCGFVIDPLQVQR